MPEFLDTAIHKISSADPSRLPIFSQGKEPEKFNSLSEVLSGRTSLGNKLEREFEALNQKMEAYSKRPMPTNTATQPAPEAANSNRNSPSLSR